jgi:alkylation response protein AidB-like acyl-CoA dehydrogenase
MKGIALAAMVAGIAAAAVSADASTAANRQQDPTVQQSCPVAPAVANMYLRNQAGRRLTMPRGEVIAEITKQTGAEGEFAGLKPCESGYPNAVRFWIDEVIKAGTDNSTPQA